MNNFSGVLGLLAMGFLQSCLNAETRLSSLVRMERFPRRWVGFLTVNLPGCSRYWSSSRMSFEGKDRT